MKILDSAKRTLELLSVVIYMTAILSCDTYGMPDVQTDVQTTPVRITVNMPSCTDNGSKSAFTGPADKLYDINVYVYSDGILQESVYTRNTDDVILYLFPGKEYRFYAIANVGEITPPETENSLHAYRYSVGQVAETNTRGLPMASVPTEGPVIYSTQEPINIDLIRLVAEYTFMLDRNMLQHSQIEITSVRIRQSALDILPFAEESAAIQAEDWDYATPSDISLLNAGGSIKLYIPENCQGRLLPDNTDQWSKVPDNIPEKKDICTYLEVEAKYTSPGVESDNLVYRMYLGEDAITDFNIRRNTQNIVTLKVTDEGIYKASWMVDKGDLTDWRQLNFDRDYIEVTKGGSIETLYVIRDPWLLEYRVQYEYEDEGLHLEQYDEEISLWVSDSYSGISDILLYMFSWDNRINDVCMVSIKEKTGYVCFESATGTAVLRNAPHGIEITGSEFMQCSDYKVCYNYLGGTNICNYSFSKSSSSVSLDLGVTGRYYWDLGNAAFMNGSPITNISVSSSGTVSKTRLSDLYSKSGTAKENWREGTWDLTDNTGLYIGSKSQLWEMTGMQNTTANSIGKVQVKNADDADEYVFKWYIRENRDKNMLELVIHLGNFGYSDASNQGAFLWESFNSKRYSIRTLTYDLYASQSEPYVTGITPQTPSDEGSFYHISRL